MKTENHTMNGEQKEKKVTIISMFNTVKRWNIAQVSMLASIIVACFALFGFVRNTQTANRDIPEIKNSIAAHEKKDQNDKVEFKDILTEIKLSVKDIQGDVKLVNQKVDDMKAYGVGEYHRETKELIKKAE